MESKIRVSRGRVATNADRLSARVTVFSETTKLALERMRLRPSSTFWEELSRRSAEISRIVAEECTPFEAHDAVTIAPLREHVAALRKTAWDGLRRCFERGEPSDEVVNAARAVLYELHDLVDMFEEWQERNADAMNRVSRRDRSSAFAPLTTGLAFRGAQDLETGDILVTRRTPGEVDQSHGVSTALSRTLFGHSGMVYRDPPTRKVFVLEDTRHGSLMTPIDDFLRLYEGRVTVLRGRTRETRDRLRIGAEIGAADWGAGKRIPFDLTGDDSRENPRKYCAAYVRYLAELGGLVMPVHDSLRMPVRECFRAALAKSFGVERRRMLWPDDFSLDPRLGAVAERRRDPWTIRRMRVETVAYTRMFEELFQRKIDFRDDLFGRVLARIVKPWVPAPSRIVNDWVNFTRVALPMIAALEGEYERHWQDYGRPMTRSEMEEAMKPIFEKYKARADSVWYRSGYHSLATCLRLILRQH